VLTVSPPRRTRIQGIGRFDPGFGMGAFWALVVSMLESFRSRRHGNRNHPRLAFRAARTVNRQQLWIWSRPRHGAKISRPETVVCSVPDKTPSKSGASVWSRTLAGGAAGDCWNPDEPGGGGQPINAEFTKALRCHAKYIARS
jgi:hypothetical protein